MTPVQNTYDQYSCIFGSCGPTDPLAYSCGNPTTKTSLGAVTQVAFDPAGVVYQVTDGSGISMTATTDPTTNYTLPSQLVLVT